jgi:predicted ATPase/DNA-binding CsgD family transcriptional regulator
LGLRDAAGVSPEAQVLSHLAGRPRLLVLDNCEQIVDAVAQLVNAAVAAAPNLHVLVTSRSVLNVAAERVWPVPALDLPAIGASAADVARSDAGRLFADRAQSRRPEFVIDGESAEAVARVCHLLDGLPLALELAAAWTAVLSPADIVGRLEDSLALLDVSGTGGGRHRTLRATVEWSDALLDPGDRQVFAQLSLFAGSFTLHDAGALVANGEGDDVVFALRHLVDSSWVVATPNGEETTYALLNTLRAYGRELLDRSGETEELRGRHARIFMALAEASEEALAGPQQTRWRDRMERATGDIEAALTWAFDQADIDVGFRLVASLWRWWYTTGQLVEGRRWAALALGRSRAVSPALRARALYVSAMLASENGDYPTATAHAQMARREFTAIGDHRGAARSSTVLGNIAKYHGDFAAAQVHMDKAVASQRSLGDDWGTAVALQNLASLIIDAGDLATGRELMEESLGLKRKAGDRRSLGYGLTNLSDLLLRERAPDRARLALAEAGSIAVELSDDRLAGFVHHNLGDVAAFSGDQAGAIAAYQVALERFRRVHDRRDVALALCSLGRALSQAGEPGEGLSLLHESEALAADLGDELRLSEARAALAAVAAPPASQSLPDGLTARQAEILGLLAGGLSNRDIATRLSLSAGTVERHLANVYVKLGVRNRVAATRYALAHGLGARSGP